MGLFKNLVGTMSAKFQLGIQGLMIKAADGKIRVRNAADNADAPLVGSIIAASGDDIELNENAAGSGGDRKYTLRRPGSGMTGDIVLTLPPDDGSPGQVLQTDGNGVMTWLTVEAGNNKTVVDTTALAFDSTSPVAMFTLPVNAVVQLVRIIIDDPFDGTPSASVGVTGSTSKYAGASDMNLTAEAETVFEVAPGKPANGSTEALIITYAANGATEGAARILVEYVIPS